MRAQKTKRNGYALLLGTLLLSFMLVLALSISTLVTKQVILSNRFSNATAALAAADSGMERALYVDYRIITPGVMNFTSGIETDGITPNNDPFSVLNKDRLSYNVLVTTVGTLKKINSQGAAYGTRRAIEREY